MFVCGQGRIYISSIVVVLPEVHPTSVAYESFSELRMLTWGGPRMAYFITVRDGPGVGWPKGPVVAAPFPIPKVHF